MQTPPMPPSYQSQQDADHLKLLAIFYYVLSGLSVAATLFGGVYLAMGMMIKRTIHTMSSTAGSMPTTPAGSPHSTIHVVGTPSGPPAEIGTLFTGIGIAIILVCVIMAVCNFLCARWLSARRNRTFCIVTAAINCLNIPLGLTLAIFTFLVLLRPSVTALFAEEPGLAAPRS